MKKYIEDTIKYYDETAKEYFEEWHKFEYPFPDIFLGYLKPNAKILELGCGTGRDSLYFKNKGYEVVPIDASSELCKIASKVLDIEVCPMNFLDIDFENEFDGVFATASLLHLDDDDLIDVLKKVSKSLKFGGIAYVSFKYGDGERQSDGRFFNDMNEARFRDICKETPELEIIKIYEESSYEGYRPFINFFLRKREVTC